MTSCNSEVIGENYSASKTFYPERLGDSESQKATATEDPVFSKASGRSHYKSAEEDTEAHLEVSMYYCEFDHKSCATAVESTNDREGHQTELKETQMRWPYKHRVTGFQAPGTVGKA